MLSGTGRGNGMWKGGTGRGRLGVKSLSGLFFLRLYIKRRFSKGPGSNLMGPSHVSVCCCQQLILESQLDPARLLCLKPKSTLACFHGNGKRTNASDMTPLF